MKIQENTVLAQKKAKEQAAAKAAEELRMQQQAQKRRQQMAKEAQRHEEQRTVNFNELYGNMVPVSENVQTDADLKYEHHSAAWEQRLAEGQKQFDDQFEAAEEIVDGRENPASPHFYSTIDREEEYNGMLVQMPYEHHSKAWE